MIEVSLDEALQAAERARDKARVLDVSVSVAVVDESGRPIVVLRGDNLGFLTADFALAKAVGAAGLKRSTDFMAERWDDRPSFWISSLQAASSKYMPATGAVPIYKGERIVGAIGCGGASHEQDHECALAGAAAIK